VPGRSAKIIARAARLNRRWYRADYLSIQECSMWIILFIIALLFVLGGALILLRTAKMPKIPKNVKSQPYEDDKTDDW
jgi:hypothetical protein